MTGPATAPAPAAAPHVPVLLDGVIAGLAIGEGDTMVDGTFGAGGYARAILAAGAGALYAFDRDPDAIAAAPARIDDPRLTLIEAPFSQMAEELAARGVEAVDGVTLDIGVSSMQLDQPERGFAFSSDGPLDMRMSRSGTSAADFVNEADEAEIARVLKLYGEEPRARRVAAAIVRARPLQRTGELAAVVRKALGHHPGMKSDPATRTFQAIRIHLNAELEELEAGLGAAERLLRPGGRLAVVTFHSLEDRIVKQFLRSRSGGEPAGSRHRPAVAAPRAPSFAHVAKPLAADEAEVAANPRSRSARLRVAVRTGAPAWDSAALAAGGRA
jgi:16S rRNA (cytosine1402-N4)-methyltransferase